MVLGAFVAGALARSSSMLEVTSVRSSFPTGASVLVGGADDSGTTEEWVRIVSYKNNSAASRDSGVRYEVWGSAVVKEDMASQKT